MPETVHLMMRRFESSAGALKGGKKMKNYYVVTVEIDGVVTNRLVKAETAEEAEKEALECASRKTMDLPVQN